LHWITLTLISAFFLGIYELCTKHAVRDNAVMPVLFLGTVFGALVWGALVGVQVLWPGLLPPALVPGPLTTSQHLQLALKSAVVAASWIFTYFGLKHIPLSLASPIRATSPLWSLLGGLIILAERPTALEILGVLTAIVSFIGLSVAGRGEGLRLHRDKWVGFLLVGTLLTALCALYDKYLLDRAGISVPAMQAWFSFYLVLFFLPVAIGWQRRWWERNEFHWRWSIPFIAFSLLLADYVYFAAIRDPASLVSLVMSLRRAGTLVAFAGGLLFFGEQNGLKKLPAVIGIIVGILLTVLG
jgi:bacterial/archaeal transporter family protein